MITRQTQQWWTMFGRQGATAAIESPPGVSTRTSWSRCLQKGQLTFYNSCTKKPSMVAINIDGHQVRSVYHACMNEPLIEEIGLQPLKDKLRSMGGWPVLEVNLRHHVMAAFTNLDSREMTGTRRISAGSTQPTSSVRTATAPISSLTSLSWPI